MNNNLNQRKKRVVRTKSVNSSIIEKRNALNKINREVKNEIQRSLPSKQKLRQAETLPPAKRKVFLRKLAVSFAKGAAIAAGAAVTIGITYKLSKKTIHREIQSAVRSATNEATNNIQKSIPGISEQLRSEVGTTISQINPVVQETVRNTVDNATAQALKNVKENEPVLMETANKIAGAAVEGAQQNVSGPLSFIVGGGGGKKKKEQEAPSKPVNPENKNKNLKKQVDKGNIIESPVGTPEGKRLTRSALKEGKKSETEQPTETTTSLAPVVSQPEPTNLKQLSEVSKQITQQQGGPNIQEVEFGKRKIHLKQLKKDLKKLKKI